MRSDFDPIVNIDMLFSESIRWFLRLAADESNEKYLANLKTFIEAIQKTTKAATADVENTAPAPVPAPAPGPAAVPDMSASAPIGAA